MTEIPETILRHFRIDELSESQDAQGIQAEPRTQNTSEERSLIREDI